jgi:hypothetical protein
MTRFFGFESAVEKVGAASMMAIVVLLGVATATAGLPIWA